jgi:uncharacterized coiled-coil protein SlyX
MHTEDDKVRVSARISRELYDSVCQIDDNFTRVLVAALTLLTKEYNKERQTDYDYFKTNNDDDLRMRVSDMTEQIDFLKSQVTTKDSQLEKQAFHIQSLIQENSKLNIKLLPENAEKSKPWWRFW